MIAASFWAPMGNCRSEPVKPNPTQPNLNRLGATGDIVAVVHWKKNHASGNLPLASHWCHPNIGLTHRIQRGRYRLLQPTILIVVKASTNMEFCNQCFFRALPRNKILFTWCLWCDKKTHPLESIFGKWWAQYFLHVFPSQNLART